MLVGIGMVWLEVLRDTSAETSAELAKASLNVKTTPHWELGCGLCTSKTSLVLAGCNLQHLFLHQVMHVEP